jgi:hypothetical protein
MCNKKWKEKNNACRDKKYFIYYMVNYTYIRSSDPKGFVSSFKTLELVAEECLTANSTYASKL